MVFNASFAQTAAGSVATGTCATGTYGQPQRQCNSDGTWATTLLRNPCSSSMSPCAWRPVNGAAALTLLTLALCDRGGALHSQLVPVSDQRQQCQLEQRCGRCNVHRHLRRWLQRYPTAPVQHCWLGQRHHRMHAYVVSVPVRLTWVALGLTTGR